MVTWKVESEEGEEITMSVAGCEDMNKEEFLAHLSKYTDEYRAKLEKVFSKYQNQQNWKYQFTVMITDIDEATLLVDAIGFFHGAKAKTKITSKGIEVHSDGYKG